MNVINVTGSQNVVRPSKKPRREGNQRNNGSVHVHIGEIPEALGNNNTNNNESESITPVVYRNVWGNGTSRSGLHVSSLKSLLPFQRSAITRVKNVIQGQPFNFITSWKNKNGVQNFNKTVIPRGQLFWLNTGSGKTTIGAGTVLSHILSVSGEFPLQVIVLSNQMNKKIVSESVYTSEVKKHYGPWLRGVRNPDKILSKVKFFTYQQMYNAFFEKQNAHKAFKEGIDKKNVQYVVIIDEIHDLVSPGAGPQERKIRDRLIQLASPACTLKGTTHPLFTVYGMTSTPGDTIDEFAKILSIVGPSVPCARPNRNINSEKNYRIDGFTVMLGDIYNKRNISSRARDNAELIMNQIVFRRNKNAMVNNTGTSIYPVEKYVDHRVPYDELFYLLSLDALGRDVSQMHNNHKKLLRNGSKPSYLHSSQASPISKTPKSENKIVPTSITKSGSRLQTFKTNEGIPEIDPRSSRWLDHYLRYNTYMSFDELKQVIPYFPTIPKKILTSNDAIKKKKSTLKQVVQRLFPKEDSGKKYYNGNFKKESVVKTGVVRENGEEETQKVIIPFYYYTPLKGKLMCLVQDVMKAIPGPKNRNSAYGRKLVYFKDPSSAEVFANLLGLTPMSRGGKKYIPFRNVTDTVDSMSSFDMLFKKTRLLSNGTSQSWNSVNQTQVKSVVNFLYDAIKQIPINQSSRYPYRNFVLATGQNASKVASKASKLMDSGGEFDHIIEMCDRYIKYNRDTNQTMMTKVKYVKRKIEEYNLLGDRLELIVIGGGNLYQALNIRGLQDVYIMDEFHKPLQWHQVKGRASRGFGHHIHSNVQNRVVRIHTYTYFNQQPLNYIIKRMGNFNLKNQEVKKGVEYRIEERLKNLLPITKILGKKFQEVSKTERIKYDTAIKTTVARIIQGLQFLHAHHLLYGIPGNHHTVALNKTIMLYRKHNPNFVKMRSVKNSLKNIARTQQNTRYPPGQNRS